jgi:hypothetical protein
MANRHREPAWLCCAQANNKSGEDQGTGIDLVRLDIGVLVLAFDERAERLRINFFGGAVGSEQNVGLMEGLPNGDHIAAVEALQHNA